eukprot:TRINITY_DN27942_c0_g1_i1.p1 TRINITY_DN27942_c0_g1~~TRINITY_DN27942_c0_g1_i1.p1  ORF type:complete len:453 (+),score=25.67 TRINITY_DN27942_c0_g1_i1:105-1463(+)
MDPGRYRQPDRANPVTGLEATAVTPAAAAAAPCRPALHAAAPLLVMTGGVVQQQPVARPLPAGRASPQFGATATAAAAGSLPTAACVGAPCGGGGLLGAPCGGAGLVFAVPRPMSASTATGVVLQPSQIHQLQMQHCAAGPMQAVGYPVPAMVQQSPLTSLGPPTKPHTVLLSACVHPCLDRRCLVDLSWLYFHTAAAQDHAVRTGNPSWCLCDRSTRADAVGQCPNASCKFAHIQHPEYRREVLRRLNENGISRGRGPLPNKDNTVLVGSALTPEDVQCATKAASLCGFCVRLEPSSTGVRIEFLHRGDAERMIRRGNIALPSGKCGRVTFSLGPINETQHTVYHAPTTQQARVVDTAEAAGAAAAAGPAQVGQLWSQSLRKYLTTRAVPQDRAAEIISKLASMGCECEEDLGEILSGADLISMLTDPPLGLKPLEQKKLQSFVREFACSS